jgi:hypothetical protein
MPVESSMSNSPPRPCSSIRTLLRVFSPFPIEREFTTDVQSGRDAAAVRGWCFLGIDQSGVHLRRRGRTYLQMDHHEPRCQEILRSDVFRCLRAPGASGCNPYGDCGGGKGHRLLLLLGGMSSPGRAIFPKVQTPGTFSHAQ